MADTTSEDKHTAMATVDEISVAMATYNGGKFLREQLDSLAKQTAKPAELVVCDDISSDATVQLLGDFARSASFPVHVHINDSRLGFGDNFLKAALLCKSSLIAFCDQDDVWYPQKLETCARALADCNADLCAHDADLCGISGELIGYHSAGVDGGTYGPLRLDPWGTFFGFTCTFRRSLLEIASPAIRKSDDQDRRLLSHDGWIYFLAHSFGRIVYLAEPLAKYRQHGTNLFGSNDLTGLQKVHRLMTEYEAYLRKYKAFASTRGRILDETSKGVPSEFSSATTMACQYWKNIETLQSQRLSVAETKSLVGRLRGVINLWCQGTYAPSPVGGLGRRALAEDSVGAFARSLFRSG